MDIYSQGMRDRSMRSETELAREIKPTDWSMAGNLSNRSSGVQIPRVICTRQKKKMSNVVYSGHALGYTKLVHRHATQAEGNKYFK